MTSPAAFAKWAERKAEAHITETAGCCRRCSKTTYTACATDTYALLGPLVAAGDELQQAEHDFRRVYETFGDGSSQAGRAWDLMRRAGDKYRQALTALKEQLQTVQSTSEGHVDQQGLRERLESEGE